MGSFQRAVCNLRRKPRKAATLTAVMAVAVCMALLSIGIFEATRGISAALKQAAAPEASVYADDGHGSVDEDLAAQLGKLDVVKNANRMRVVDAFPENFKNIEGTMRDPGFDDAVRVSAYDDLSSGSPFADQLVRLVQGSLVAPGDEHAAVVHVDLAEANGLGIGDAFELSGVDGQRTEVRIIGLYAGAGGNEGAPAGVTARNQSFNQIYTDNATAADLGAVGFAEVRLTFADPDRVNEATASIGQTCGGGFVVELYDSALSLLSAPLDQGAAAAQATLVLVALTGTVAVAILLALWGRSRAHERAVLLALGRRKVEVVSQALAESALLYAAAAVLACLAAALLSPSLVRAIVPSAALQAAAEAGADVAATVTVADAATSVLAGLAVVAITTVTCAIVALRRNPRELLTDKG